MEPITNENSLVNAADWYDEPRRDQMTLTTVAGNLVGLDPDEYLTGFDTVLIDGVPFDWRTHRDAAFVMCGWMGDVIAQDIHDRLDAGTVYETLDGLKAAMSAAVPTDVPQSTIQEMVNAES